MKSLLFTLICLALPFIGTTQDAHTEVKRLAYGNPFDPANANFIRLDNEMEHLRERSLLLNETWESIEIYGIDSSLVILDTANYHIKDDLILFVNDNTMYQLFPEKVQYVILGETKYISAIFEDEPKHLARGYFEVLAEGEYTLLQRHYLETEVVNNSPLGLPSTKEEYLVQDTKLYYLRSGSDRPVVLPRKKSEFVKIFRRSRNEVIDYAKANRISPKNTDEVIQLFEYYNNNLVQ